MAKTWLITGCLSRLGEVLSHAVLARGDNLVATARDPGTLQSLADRHPGNVRIVALDVRLDILVNNAGFIGAIEAVNPPDTFRCTVDAAEPPLHLPLGPRSYAPARDKLATFQKDIGRLRTGRESDRRRRLKAVRGGS